jgi:hypothetical protein
LRTNVNYANSAWRRWAASFDRASGVGSFVYVDGADATSARNGTMPTGSASNAFQFRMGTLDGVTTDDFDGNLAHVWIAKRKMSLAECEEVLWKPGSLPLDSYWPIYGIDSPEIDLGTNKVNLTVGTSGLGTPAESSDGPPVSIGTYSPVADWAIAAGSDAVPVCWSQYRLRNAG